MRRGLCWLLAGVLCWGIFGSAHAEVYSVPQDIFVPELITVATEELGYTEEKSGYTKYADWGGDNKYGEWCSEFVSWCVDQADLRLGSQWLDSMYPMQTACITGVKWFTSRGRYVTAIGTLKGYGAQWHREDGVPLSERPYVPKPGDLIYFEWYKYNRIDHVGLVEYVEEVDGAVLIHTIEGNNKEADYVKRFSYPLDDPSIRAYGVIRDDIGTEMKAGCEGELVRQLQELLAGAGYLDEKNIDGVYGGKTIAAVKKLQAAKELKQTGVADRLTQEALGVGFEG